MTQSGYLTRPVMGGRAGLRSDQAGRNLRQSLEECSAPHLLAPDNRAIDLAEIVSLANEFGVSKEAMARGYVEARRETMAILVLHNDRLDRVYRSPDFPWIEPGIRQSVPADSLASSHGLLPGEMSEMEECDPETWLGERHAGRVEVLSEQVLVQSNGYAVVLLHAELDD